MINYISHKKSKQIVNGLPKLPTSDQLKEGEIAINYANGYETLSIKNSENEIITFSSTEQFEKYVDTTIGNKLGSGFTGGNSANTVTSVVENNEKITSSALNDLNDRKLDATAYTPTDLSDYYKKEETSSKTELENALKLKANTSDLTAHTGNSTVHITSAERTKWNNAATTLASHSGNTTVHITSDERSKWNGKISNVQYNKTDKKINFYSGATTETPVSSIDATDFIKDGMVSNVEIKDVTSSGSCLVITFNADAGKQNIVIPVSKIFNPANYYLKSETSGKTELDTAFGLKANTSDLTAHTSNSTIHITSDERTKWNNASANSHTHANKAVLDTITAIDTELSETSNNLVVNSAITTVILANERIASSSLNDLNERKLDASAYTPTDLSGYYKKEETSAKTELDDALKLKANSTDLATKANTSDLTAHTGNSTIHITSNERNTWNGKISNVQYNKTDKKIYFYSGATTETPMSNIDATDFIKDGMVSNVEIKDVTNSGSCLVITFNADAGKQDITIPITKIFNPANYYLKSETSGKTELDTAFVTKANASDLTAHTGDSTVHITSAERTKWNDAATSSHTHANKAVLDTITAIDKELSETSNNLVVNSAITTVILANEKITSSSLNDLNDRKLDASAYTPTDLSDYYKKEETSSKTELDTALGLKANATDLTAHTGNTTAHITSDERTKWNGAATTLASHSGDTTVHITSDERTKWNGAATTLASHSGDTTVHITADERTNWNNAVTSSHTHANKAVLDTITAIDTELSETSNNLVVNSAITKVIEDNERITSASLNDLNERKLDASAYTPTDLSDYYKKEDTSGKTELDAALNSKSNTGHTHLSSDITDKVTGITESNSGSTSVPTVSAVMQVFKDNEKTISASLNDLNDKISQLDALIKKYDARITALENK